MAGFLSKLAGGFDKFANELITPTSGLGKLGAYLGAASGSPLGQAQMAALADQRRMMEQAGSEEDRALERQIKQAQLQNLLNPKPVNNDTVNDYNFYSQRFGPEFADNWLRNNSEKPVAVQSVNPATGEATTYFVRPSMIGQMAGGAKPSFQPSASLPQGFTVDAGGPSQPATGGFRR